MLPLSPAVAFKAAPWVLLAAAAGLALWYRAEAEACEASIAVEAARAHERVAAAKASDAAMTRELETKLRPIVDQLQEQARATQTALAKVPNTPACDRTPAARAFDSSVRPDPQQAGPGQPRPARP